MPTSRVPELIDALIREARTALESTDVLVLDGYGLSGDPGDFLMIGVEDPGTSEAAFSASSDQSVATMGTNRPRDENGSVTCAAYSWNGDGDQKAARDASYSFMAAMETFLRADPTLGIAAGGYFKAELGSTQRLSQNQTDAGADALLLFNVQFFARI